jgi:hypothetical protein
VVAIHYLQRYAIDESRGAMRSRGMLGVAVLVLGIAAGIHAYRTYQRDIKPKIRTDVVRPSYGSVQAVVASGEAGVITKVLLGGGGLGAVQGWYPDVDRRNVHVLSIEVILPTPPTEPPVVAAIILRGDVVAGDGFIGGQSVARGRDGPFYDVFVGSAGGVDQETGRARGSFRIETRVQYGWCVRTQCYIEAPTVEPPVLEPKLAAAKGDPRADIGPWWNRFVNPPLLHQEPATVAGTLIVDAGRIPLSATLASISPPATIANNQRLIWQSDARFTAVASLVEGELEATRQDRVFLAGVEIGAATALIPWGMQLLFDIVPSRRTRRRTGD